MNLRKFKGIWIEKAIWLRKDLSANEKVLWAEIDSLDDEEMGGCFASNKYLCEFLQVQERTLQILLARLKRLGLIQDVKTNGRTRILKAIQPNDKSSIDTPGVYNNSYDHEKFDTPGGTPSDIYNKAYVSTKVDTEEARSDENSAQTVSTKPLHARKCDFIFSHEKRVYEGITPEDLATWKALYTSVDVAREISASIQWLLANPSKARKTNWRKFLVGWLGRANETASNRSAYASISKVDRRTKNKDGTPVDVDYGW